MAEFVEVMQQARRLCAAHGGMCNYRNCPLDNGKECRLYMVILKCRKIPILKCVKLPM